MKNLPIMQVGKSQGMALQLPIQPDAKVVQADFGGQACLKASESMWAFFGQTKRVEEFVKNAFNALTQVS